MKYHFKYYKDERGGFWGECLEIQGCRSEGDTIDELKINFKEALDLCLECTYDEHEKFIYPFPENKVKGKNILSIQPEPAILFSNILKDNREKSHLTQKQVADKLGYKNIWAYQKLEKGKYGNITLKTISKILEIFPDITLDSIFKDK